MTLHILWVALKKVDLVAIRETSITKIVSLLNSYYIFEFTSTETSAGGTLLYISNRLPYNKLNIYKKKALESIFIEIWDRQAQKSIIIVTVLYRYPSVDLNDFNSN